MGRIRDLWLGDIETWLSGYSAYMRAESRAPRRSFLSALDFLTFSTGHAQEIRFPGIDVKELLRDRVARDWEIPLTQEEIDALPVFNDFHQKLLLTKATDIASGNLPDDTTP